MTIEVYQVRKWTGKPTINENLSIPQVNNIDSRNNEKSSIQ